nr:MAG TPA: hypothetical protein [Caudoviricetes sp.]
MDVFFCLKIKNFPENFPEISLNHFLRFLKAISPTV